MKFLIQFDDARALDPGVVGRKFASLARASRLGFEVPCAAAVTTEAHRFYLSHRCWPDGLAAEVKAVGDMLGLSRGLSIRSSAVREDLKEQSFAGQYRSFLQVDHADDLQNKIEMCWLSAEEENVRSYLRAGDRGNAAGEIPLMGVVLQRMVHAVAAGVAFGRNPLNPARDEIVIEGISGSGESLVSGHVSPHRAFVGGEGHLRIDLPPDAGPAARRSDCLLAESDWRRVAALLRRLEKSVGESPLDIEWAIDGGRTLWLLQYRRITTIEEGALTAPPGTWTRRIVDDLWADRLTPFLADIMLQNEPRFNLNRVLKIVGIPVVSPMLAVINGYLYLNCAGLRSAVARLPLRLRTADVRALFPHDGEVDAIAVPGASQLAATLLRALLLPVFQPEVNPLLCLWLARGRRAKIRRRLDGVRAIAGTTTGQCLNKVRRALEVLLQIQIWNQWPYGFATFFTLVLRWLMVDYRGASHAAFLARISRGGNNVTIDIERCFRDLAGHVRNNPELLALFRTHDPEAVLRLLPVRFRAELVRILALYGCRSRHRTLYIKRWAEAPQEVIGILQALARRQTTSAGVAERAAATDGDSVDSSDLMAERSLLLTVLRVMTRKFLDLREDLRFLLDEALFEIRKALLEVGGHTGLGDAVLFLKLAELEQLAAGETSLEDMRRLAGTRHRRFLQGGSASSFLVDGRPTETFTTGVDAIRGIGTSAGQASGPARIVHDPSRADIHPGDILVAANTDPGWTPILSLAGGLVVEEGGLLNHCSIVARELRIPAVVGVRNATRRIPEGAQIVIDGGQGLVRIEDDDRERPQA
ncbi:MAG: PEP/pyruvate-binding domain-containing protein [Desulfobacterales bacterium]